MSADVGHVAFAGVGPGERSRDGDAGAADVERDYAILACEARLHCALGRPLGRILRGPSVDEDPGALSAQGGGEGVRAARARLGAG